MLGWCWALVGPYSIYLGSFGIDEGPFLGPFLRAKNYDFFCATRYLCGINQSQHTYTHIHIYTYTLIYIYIYIFTYMHINIYTYIQMYIYTYIHIFTGRGGEPCLPILPTGPHPQGGGGNHDRGGVPEPGTYISIYIYIYLSLYLYSSIHVQMIKTNPWSQPFDQHFLLDIARSGDLKGKTRYQGRAVGTDSDITSAGWLLYLKIGIKLSWIMASETQTM